MSADHLLSLATLHTAAPGVLDVIFRRDGDFDGAPRWRDTLVTGAGDRVRLAHEVFLDLRIPSVAVRLAGLCARALMGRLDGTVMLECGIYPEIRLGYVWGLPLQAVFTIWTHEGRCVAGGGPHLPPPPLGQYSSASFLAALTLSLAPRIVTLEGPNG